MKKVYFTAFLVLTSTLAFAQKKAIGKQKAASLFTKSNAVSPPDRTSIMLKSSGVYQAYMTAGNAASPWRINDPVVNQLIYHEKGTSPPINKSGLMGVPVGTYGFAHGKILLYSNDATSSGGSTGGSGAVGTGTSPAGIGISGPATGVNGKSPNAGFGPYGERITSFKDITTNWWGMGNAMDSTNKRKNHE